MRTPLLEALVDARRRHRPAVLVTDLVSGAQALRADGADTGDLAIGPELDAWIAEAERADRSGTVAIGDAGYFIQVFSPPLRLVLVGAVHIAQALAPMAALAGYAVIVVDPRRRFATAERFPDIRLEHAWPDEALAALRPDRRTAVVTLTHDPKLDDPALDTALRSQAFYLAALGSRRTHARRLERLAALGHGPAELERVHGPAGLALGAVTPAEIAVSILAQMTRCLRAAPRLTEPRPPEPGPTEPGPTEPGASGASAAAP